METVSRELVPPVGSGSVRSYVDTTGAAHVLAPRTALGQIVALAAKRDVPVTVQFFASFNSGLLQRFASGQSATGGWQFTVNGVPSQVGADTAVVPRGAEVVWWLIDDFGKQGSFLPLDLDLVSKKANGDVRFRVTRFDTGVRQGDRRPRRDAPRQRPQPHRLGERVRDRRTCGTARSSRPAPPRPRRSARNRSAARRENLGGPSLWLALPVLVAGCGEHRVQASP